MSSPKGPGLGRSPRTGKEQEAQLERGMGRINTGRYTKPPSNRLLGETGEYRIMTPEQFRKEKAKIKEWTWRGKHTANFTSNGRHFKRQNHPDLFEVKNRAFNAKPAAHLKPPPPLFSKHPPA